MHTEYLKINHCINRIYDFGRFTQILDTFTTEEEKSLRVVLYRIRVFEIAGIQEEIEERTFEISGIAMMY